MIGFFHNSSISIAKGIIIRRTNRLCHSKSISDLKSLYRSNGENRLSQTSRQFIEYRFSDSRRHSRYPAANHTATGIQLTHFFFQIRSTFFCCIRIWHIKRVRISQFRCPVAFVNGVRTDCFCISKDLNSHLF